MNSDKQSSYELNQVVLGDRLVVEDLYKSSCAYSEGVDEYFRYEVRFGGLREGNFADLTEVKRFLEDDFDEADRVVTDVL